MKTKYLFPNSFKKSSGLLFMLSLLAVIIVPIINSNNDVNVFELQANVFALFNDDFFTPQSMAWIKDDIFPELLGILLIVSGLIFAFSKEKTEDEMISKIRVESLVWATYINYALLLFCIIFIYGTNFLTVMIYNMFTLLFFFIIRFHWMLYKNNKINSHDE